MNYIITESQLKVLIKEQNLTLPYTKKGSHTAPNGDCDALHGFQLSRIGSDMNGIVKTELDKFSNQGVWVSDVKVTVNGMKVDWEVTIDKSSDGQFWNGFTSRGAGCNSGIDKRWNSEEVGNGPESIKTNIINDKDKQGNKKTPICKNVSNIELVKKVEFTNLGKNSFIQGFYRYKCGDEVKKTQPTQQKTSNPPVEKSITTTSTIPQKSTTPVSTTEKPTIPDSVPSQKPITTPQTPKIGNRKIPIPSGVTYREKYGTRIGN